MKKLLCFPFIFFSFIISISALDIKSDNYVLYNLDNDTIVIEQNRNELTSIASLTKIMTTLVAVENINNLQTTVTITSKMLEGLAKENASVIGLSIGQTVTYEDLLYASLLSSGADATNALAYSISGNLEDFITLMNERAKTIGMTNTVFKNNTGLDAEGQHSTVEDVSKLLKEAIKNETFYQVFTTKKYTLSNKLLIAQSTFFKSASSLGISLPYVEGAKTGYTYAAGRCAATIAYDEKNDIHYMLVTTNAPTSLEYSYNIVDAKKVYEHVFSNYNNHILVNKGDLLVTIPTKYSKAKDIQYYASAPKFYYSNEFNQAKVEIKYTGLTQVSYKNKEGSTIGKIEIKYDGELVEEIDIILNEKVNFSLKEFIIVNKHFFISVISVIILIAIIYNLIKSKKI